jgi:Zn finger protein HypA/HybF involved in hydrogenase expression
MKKDITREKEETAELRRYHGLAEIIDGKVECMRCEKSFMSKNVKINRVCSDCKNSEFFWEDHNKD